MTIATLIFGFILGFVLCAIVGTGTDDDIKLDYHEATTQPFVARSEAVNLETYKAIRAIPKEQYDVWNKDGFKIEDTIKNDAAYTLFDEIKKNNAIQYRKTVDHSRGIVSMEACIRVGVPQNDKERDYEY